MSSMAATAAGRLSVAVSSLVVSKAAPAEGESRVAVLLVDTERVTTSRSTARCRDLHRGPLLQFGRHAARRSEERGR